MLINLYRIMGPFPNTLAFSLGLSASPGLDDCLLSDSSPSLQFVLLAFRLPQSLFSSH